WIGLFSYTGKVSYEYADQIITLCESNRAVQLAEGADKQKTKIIPNGIFPERYEKTLSRFKEREKKPPFIVGFVGRVVSIKDIKTFLRAVKIVYDKLPDIQVMIMGPTDEELDYYYECLELIDILEIKPIINFTGMVQLDDNYDKIDVLVLTSISEAQPLVILEANCIGIPVVATDVGACSELLNGGSEEDRNLGPSGIITGVANPRETAHGILALLQDLSLNYQYGQNGIKRVHKFYRQQDLLAEYNTLYENLKYANKV
ncbi:MAG: GT4 family glycosyltransferase PelF, partial [Fibrobacteria bacterium]|nr:GT4 family glycosyltransferase PelF [Fibrobacteria bacterium]